MLAAHSRCGNSGDSWPAILGIVRFASRDSVPLSAVDLRPPLACHRLCFGLRPEIPLSTQTLPTEKNSGGINFGEDYSMITD